MIAFEVYRWNNAKGGMRFAFPPYGPTALAINSIKSAVNNGELISHPQLISILFRWEELAEDDGAEVKAWTSEQLRNDETVSMLARAFTGESWSQGMGMFGLGDRVAMRNVKASVEGLERIIDINEFRRRLEEIEKNDAIDSGTKENILIFLEAWRNQERGLGRALIKQ